MNEAERYDQVVGYNGVPEMLHVIFSDIAKVVDVTPKVVEEVVSTHTAHLGPQVQDRIFDFVQDRIKEREEDDERMAA